ncbi:hypothetical protein ACIP5Y_27115 [Nocardia sp. NPDC088792]|uniref:hypothetical protein n=1 Tax=Nocardia sp. NPDC088792 TaxID=3364332 RepID=UPI003800BDF6
MNPQGAEHTSPDPRPARGPNSGGERAAAPAYRPGTGMNSTRPEPFSPTHRHTTVRSRLSRPLTALAAFSVTAGVVSGGISYAMRSSQREAHVAGTAAWWQHLIVLLLAVVIIVVLARRGFRPADLLAPLTSHAAQRLRATAKAAAHHPGAALRLLLGLLPLVILVYMPWRIGEQVLGGLDPNFIANAWGGPGYFGAMACHYMDCVLLMGVSAGLLHVLLLPAGSPTARR